MDEMIDGWNYVVLLTMKTILNSILFPMRRENHQVLALEHDQTTGPPVVVRPKSKSKQRG